VNARERVRLALTGQRPDRVPLSLGFFSQSLPGIPDADEHFGLDVRYAEWSPPAGQDDFLRYLRRLPADVHVGTAAQLRTYHEWDYHPEAAGGRLSAAKSVAELAEAVFPDLINPQRYAGLAEQVQRWHEQGVAVAGSPPHLGGELFESAYRLRGFEQFLRDLKERPALANYLLDQLTAVTIHNALVLAQAGVDVLLLDDDVAMPTGLILSPAMWREFFQPRLRSIIGLAREAAPDLLVFYHSDGNFTRLIPDLVETGVNVINPVQPDCMDAAAIKAEFGDRLALWGTVGTASAWDFGAPDQIRAEVRQRIEQLGPSGLLLAPAYDIDFTPLENVVAFVEAAREDHSTIDAPALALHT
jgi:uroporphyrinogen decarboxylase